MYKHKKKFEEVLRTFYEFIPLRNSMIPKGLTSGQQNTHMSNKSNSNGFITTLDLNLNGRLKIFRTTAKQGTFVMAAGMDCLKSIKKKRASGIKDENPF